MVFRGENRGHRAGIGGESRLEHHAGFDVLEGSDTFFEFHVNAHGPRNGAYGAGTDTEFPDSLNGRFAQLGMGGQP